MLHNTSWVYEYSVEALRPTEHIIRHFGNDFYRPDDQANSVKALKETNWSSRSGLNPTRTTPPCYNNTTLDNRLCPQRKGPTVTNPICWTCKNCMLKCAADCEHCVTQSSSEHAVLIIFYLQTVIITRMLSSGGEAVYEYMIRTCQAGDVHIVHRLSVSPDWSDT